MTDKLLQIVNWHFRIQNSLNGEKTELPDVPFSLDLFWYQKTHGHCTKNHATRLFNKKSVAPTWLRSLQENPGHFWFASISGSFALFFTLSMCFRQSQALSKRPLCMQRTYYRGLEIGKMFHEHFLLKAGCFLLWEGNVMTSFQISALALDPSIP